MTDDLFNSERELAHKARAREWFAHLREVLAQAAANVAERTGKGGKA